MKIILFIILFTSGFIFSQSQEELLNQAYEQKSYVLLDKFFENWRMEKTPITDEEYQKLSDVEKDVYDIFYEFYNPKDLSNLKLEKFEYDYYKDVKYFILKSTIKYRIIISDNYDSLLIPYRKKYSADSSFRTSIFYENSKNFKIDDFRYDFIYDELFYNYSLKDSIKNFRPKIKNKTAGLLILNKGYEQIISNFLGNDIVPLGTNSIMQTAYADSISELKIEFLENYIFLMPEHWGQYWEIQTSPKIKYIDFNSIRTKARIYYKFPYHDNYSFFEKIKGRWIFIKDIFHALW